ncbi:MAG: hypothetical protein IPF68_15880 [Bacteroidales bacterium]|nr:hypothetical protein [Bacteroidales bacterium]
MKAAHHGHLTVTDDWEVVHSYGYLHHHAPTAVAVTEVNDLTTSSCTSLIRRCRCSLCTLAGWLWRHRRLFPAFTNGPLSPRLAAHPGHLDGNGSLLCHIDPYGDLYH